MSYRSQYNAIMYVLRLRTDKLLQKSGTITNKYNIHYMVQ